MQVRNRAVQRIFGHFGNSLDKCIGRPARLLLRSGAMMGGGVSFHVHRKPLSIPAPIQEGCDSAGPGFLVAATAAMMPRRGAPFAATVCAHRKHAVSHCGPRHQDAIKWGFRSITPAC